MNRLLPAYVIAVSLVFSVAANAQQPIDPSKGKAKDNTVWYDIRLLDIEGRGFDDTESFYDRLPARAKKTVRDPVWRLSQDSTGICVRFQTDAPEIAASWTLRSKNLAMPHMPATGVSGLDLYVQLPNRQWHWLGTPRPTTFPTNTATIINGITKEKRNYLLYLPLYNGVTEVAIGIPKDCRIWKATPRPKGQDKSIVFYGTSITQGGCASRPGMVHTAILGRQLDRPVINLGFSGNGRMEKEVGAFLAELDASIFVLDCLPNITAAEVSERTEPLVKQLRKAHPQTPIVLVEDRTYTNAILRTASRKRNDDSRAALKSAFERLQKAGVPNLYYIPGEHLLGADGEGTVDGSHPTDLGFMRQAEAFAKVLRPILEKTK